MRNWALTLCFALVLGGALPLLRADEPKPEPALYNVVDEATELKLGVQFAARTESENPMLGPGAIESYVALVGYRMAKSSRRPNIAYTFKVVNTATINAFALPGGHIYVYRGLLMAAENEDELAFVLGHEVGHVVGRHSINHLSRFALVQVLIEQAKSTGVVSDQVIAQVMQLVGGPATLIDLAFSREEESDADLFGIYNSVRAGWDPHGCLAMFEVFKKFTGDPSLMKKLMSSHPLPQVRIDDAQKELSHMKLPTGLRHSSPAFDAMKLGLRLLGPPMPEPKKNQ